MGEVRGKSERKWGLLGGDWGNGVAQCVGLRHRYCEGLHGPPVAQSRRRGWGGPHLDLVPMRHGGGFACPSSQRAVHADQSSTTRSRRVARNRLAVTARTVRDKAHGCAMVPHLPRADSVHVRACSAPYCGRSGQTRAPRSAWCASAGRGADMPDPSHEPSTRQPFRSWPTPPLCWL